MKSEKTKSFILFCDGASRGNPGPGSYGFVIYEKEELVFQGCCQLGDVTNNMAEYEGLINGLDKCRELGATVVHVNSDSELMVRQLTGKYKVRSPLLLPLFEKAQKSLKNFTRVTFKHIPRGKNTLADALANQVLDRFC